MKKYLSLIASLVLLAALLTGCGGSAASTSAAFDRGTVESAAMADEAPAAPAAGAALKNGAPDAEPTALPQNRKWIITVNLTAETDDLDALRSALDGKITGLNGYVENQSVYNGSAFQSSRRYRSANLTIRIPSDHLDAFLQDVGGLANIVRQNKSVEDVTLNYVATESRLKALQAEETRLLELLSKAETMSDLLEIEARLSEVRSDLETYGSQKRLYDNQIDYATIYLSIEEVQEYTPVEEPTLWERISKGFKDNLRGVGDDLLDVLVWFIISLPYLVVFAIAAALVALIVKPIRRRRKAKKAAKQQKNEAGKEE